MILNSVASGQVYGTSYGSAPAQFCSPPSGTAAASAPSSYQTYAGVAGAQSLLSAYSAGPSGSANGNSASDLAGQQVGYGHYVGQGIEKMDARAQKMLDNGKIDQSQYQQATQIAQSVSQNLLQDDGSDNGKKLSKSDFTEAHAAMAQARGIL